MILLDTQMSSFRHFNKYEMRVDQEKAQRARCSAFKKSQHIHSI